MEGVGPVRQMEQLWPHDTEGPWTLRLTYGLVGDRPGIVGVELWAVDPASLDQERALYLRPRAPVAITTAGARFPLKELLREQLERDRHHASDMEALASRGQVPRAWAERASRFTEATLIPSRPRGRPRSERRDFEKVAILYTDALAEGRPPTAAVAQALNVSRSTAAKLVSRARHEFQLLPETSRGRAAAPLMPPKTRRSNR